MAHTLMKTRRAIFRIPDPDGPEAQRGEFEALVSVFGVTDSYGDVVERGAFTKTLAEWTIKGIPIPVVWSHKFGEPENILGAYHSAEETEDGLLLKGRLDLSMDKAALVHKLMLAGLVSEFSFSGEVREFEPMDPEDEWGWGPMRIKDIDLWEAGPCFKGANPETELISVKSDGTIGGRLRDAAIAKAGRVLSKKNLDALASARDQIQSVIDAAGEEEPPVEETAPVESQQEQDAANTETQKTMEDAEPPAPILPPSVRAMLDLMNIN